MTRSVYGSKVNAVDRKILGMIEKAAEAGLPCPTNPEIAEAVGLNSVSSGTEYLKRLEYLNLVKVDRYAGSRIVTILKTGKRTAGTPGKPHWRHRVIAAKPKAPIVSVSERIFARHQVDAEAPRDARYTCPRCGCRSDAGCGHNTTRLTSRAYA